MSLFYKSILRPLLFSLDCEKAHELYLSLAQIGKVDLVRKAVYGLYKVEDPRLKVNLFGLNFKNPVGLAAGIDKDAVAAEFLSALGPGFIELGGVTAKAQPGNPKPRIFRYPKDHALINRLGFPGVGVAQFTSNLRRSYQKKLPSIIAVNVGKSKDVPIDNALDDYLNTFRMIEDYADFFVINVSSPNTPELRELQKRSRLKELFLGVKNQMKSHKPLLVKIAPDLTQHELDDILEVGLECNISGIIATNSTFSREGLTSSTGETGGLSGKPLFPKSLEIVSYIYKTTKGKIPIIGLGGIFSAEDAYKMFKAGASLIQFYTGMVYEGPGAVAQINKGLLKLLEKEGALTISEVIGTR